jgi:hypothetical protein
MKQLTFTQEELNAFIDVCIEQTDTDKDAYMYAGWYLRNGRKLMNEWFNNRYGTDYTDMDAEKHSDEIIDYMTIKYNEWIESV